MRRSKFTTKMTKKIATIWKISKPTAYSTSISGLNANGVYFTETVSQTPELVWESEMSSDWDQNSQK